MCRTERRADLTDEFAQLRLRFHSIAQPDCQGRDGKFFPLFHFIFSLWKSRRHPKGLEEINNEVEADGRETT